MKLTIAIPTYNRNNILKKNLTKLLPQLTDECQIIIFDNCSDESIEDSLKELLEKYDRIKIKIIRNKYNIGMTANIIKCFYECLDPWLWVVGDDDEIKDGAINTILKDIDKNNEKHLLTYAWDDDSFKRKGEVITSGIDEFIDTFETFGVVLFLSTSVYNIEKVIGSMSFANFFQTSYAPHLVILFMSLGENGECLYSDKQIVKNKAEETPANLKWDQIFIYQLTILLRLPLNPKTILKLRKRLEQLTRVWSIYHFIFTLTFNEYEKGLINKPTVLYSEIVRSFYSLDRRLSSRIACFLGFIIVRFPYLFRGIFSLIYRVVKKKDFQSDSNLRI